MTTLDLRVNQIGHQGAKCVAAALLQNTVLTTLQLDRNKIGVQGAERIAAALERNKAGFLVLTISFESQGPELCAITCTSVGGSQVALLEMEPQKTVAIVRNRVAAQLAHRGHLRLVRHDGTLLSDLEMTVGDCLLAEGMSTPSKKRKV